MNCEPEISESSPQFLSRRETLWMPYTQMKTARQPIEVKATEGSFLQLADGRRLIDGISSWWTACHGYRHPKIVAAITEQANEMPHVMMGGIVHQKAIELSSRLAGCLAGDGSRVFLSDSGSVAVEVAMKMAIQHWANQSPNGQTRRNRFVSFQNSYHGDTSGAMSVCDPEDSMHANFKGFLLEQFPQSIPDSDELEAQFDVFISANTDRVAAVIIEPLIQMAAGMRFHSAESLQRIERVCRKHDVLLIVDEVATGFGRTGSMFAHQQAAISPDIMCVGKGLTGCSVGLAATIATGRVYEPFHSDRWESALMHGPTFMGNPIACAAAIASLKLFEDEPRLQQVAAIEVALKQNLMPLESTANVSQVQCLGAVGAVRMKSMVDVGAASQFFIDRGVWIRPIRDTVYLAPAFTIEHDQLLQLCDAIAQWVNQQG
jgi:adenosylmethionine-8-amino-7-oxononanoate aminotransferase